MKNEVYLELLKYSSPWSILVINDSNRIVELKCPFKVESRLSVGKINYGEEYNVIRVRLSTDLKVVFVVEGAHFYYYHFDILV